MNYSEFIDELKPLLEEARTLFDESDTHQNPRFRKWRHQLTTTIGIIENQGYWIDCGIESRIFQVASYGSVSNHEQVATYNQELQDTINELEIITQHFAKYGDPRANNENSQVDSIIAPKVDKVMTDASQTDKSSKDRKVNKVDNDYKKHPIYIFGSGIAIGIAACFSVMSYFIVPNR